MNIPPPRIVIINGSLHGDSDNSNTYQLLCLAEQELLRRGAEVILLSPELVSFKFPHSPRRQATYAFDTEKVLKEAELADGFVFASGTHWGSPSSVLQQLLENTADTETSTFWQNKPAVILVSEHSTGGQPIVGNMMMTLSNYGCSIPPQGGMVFSRVGQLAKTTGLQWTEDVWGPKDIIAMCSSLMNSVRDKKIVQLADNGRFEDLKKYVAATKDQQEDPWDVDKDKKSFHGGWVLPFVRKFAEKMGIELPERPSARRKFYIPGPRE